ncbi:MAG: hypothetical protein J7L88_04450, partial [Thermoplasmata archaeon]|nr:hypothetical protein [Thermoplasmata archaeon]
AGGWLNCIEGSLANALSLLKKGANVDAIAEAVSSEILASIFSLKMLFLWERGLYEEYPGLKTEERKLIKGCVQSSEMVLRRLAHIVGSSREILRLNRENRPIREALMALRELKVELKGVDGEFKEDDKVRGEILLKGDGVRSINLFLSFRTPSHVVVLKPPVSYSEGILKSDVIEVKGEKRVPLHLEILKGVPSEEATIEVSIHPLLPPLKREIPYGGGEG